MDQVVSPWFLKGVVDCFDFRLVGLENRLVGKDRGVVKCEARLDDRFDLYRYYC